MNQRTGLGPCAPPYNSGRIRTCESTGLILSLIPGLAFLSPTLSSSAYRPPPCGSFRLIAQSSALTLPYPCHSLRKWSPLDCRLQSKNPGYQRKCPALTRWEVRSDGESWPMPRLRACTWHQPASLCATAALHLAASLPCNHASGYPRFSQLFS